MPILVTGGAGYIGSHAVISLLDAGHDVVVVDNLLTGIRELVPEEAQFFEGDIGNPEFINNLFGAHDIKSVMHFAGSVVVPESIEKPLAYYRNNVCASRVLLEQAVQHGVRNFVFSSSAAVYGTPELIPVDELAPTAPISPYGRSKLMFEWVLQDVAHAEKINTAALRYFNVAGADPFMRTGQSTKSATHLIKVACQVAAGRRPELVVFGNDFDTPDGTCVRDYVHVSDLVDAHLLVLQQLETGAKNLTLNLGHGRGFSVRQVINAVESETGISIKWKNGPRRKGDPAALVADPSRAKSLLSWRPKYDDLAEIVHTAYQWEQLLSRRGK